MMSTRSAIVRTAFSFLALTVLAALSNCGTPPAACDAALGENPQILSNLSIDGEVTAMTATQTTVHVRICANLPCLRGVLRGYIVSSAGMLGQVAAGDRKTFTMTPRDSGNRILGEVDLNLETGKSAFLQVLIGEQGKHATVNDSGAILDSGSCN